MSTSARSARRVARIRFSAKGQSGQPDLGRRTGVWQGRLIVVNQSPVVTSAWRNKYQSGPARMLLNLNPTIREGLYLMKLQTRLIVTFLACGLVPLMVTGITTFLFPTYGVILAAPVWPYVSVLIGLLVKSKGI